MRPKIVIGQRIRLVRDLWWKGRTTTAGTTGQITGYGIDGQYGYVSARFDDDRNEEVVVTVPPAHDPAAVFEA